MRARPTTLEGIDFNKLKIVVQRNWFWLLPLYVSINLFAYLSVRYTKNIYESESIIKLEIKSEASALGIKGLVNESNANLMSGEIEVIQSRLFLSRVVEFSHFEVSCYSIGRVLDTDLYNSAPFFINYTIKDNSILNVPIYYDPISATDFIVKVGEKGSEIKGRYGKELSLPQINIVLTQNQKFTPGNEKGYYFVINSKDVLLNAISGDNLIVEPLNFNANTIRVALKNFNPNKAQALLTTIDTLYLQYSNEQKNLANKQKIDWLTNELHLIEKKMENYENYFEDFTLKNKTTDLEQDLKQIISVLSKIDTQRFSLTQRISEINQLIDNLNAGILSPPSAHINTLPDYLGSNLIEIQKLYLEQEKLKLSYNESTYAYRQKQKTIESLRKKLTEQLEDTKKHSLLELRQLNQKKSKLEVEFASIPDMNTQFSKNKRFYKLYEELYLLMMQSKSQFEIAKAGSIPDFKILSSATLPSKAIFPNKTMIAGIGFVLSFVFILLCLGLLYLLNNKVTNTTEFEKFPEASMLGVIPSIRKSVKSSFYILDYPKSMASEAFRILRTNLDYFSADAPKKVVTVSSTVSGEGKSFIAMNLGGVIALSGKKVVLLDLDMRKPKTSLPVKIEDRSKGVSTILIRKNKWEECVVETPIENFSYIPSGPHPPNPSELLLKNEFLTLLEDLKKNYDFVLLDTPPVGLVTDGIVAIKHADIAIYIFRINYSKKDFIANLKRIIKVNKFTNITTLLNALPSKSDKGYGYGYYDEVPKQNWLKSIFNKS